MAQNEERWRNARRDAEFYRAAARDLARSSPAEAQWAQARAVELQAKADAIDPFMPCIRSLLSCAELNQDDLEPETRAAVADARRLLGE